MNVSLESPSYHNLIFLSDPDSQSDLGVWAEELQSSSQLDSLWSNKVILIIFGLIDRKKGFIISSSEMDIKYLPFTENQLKIHLLAFSFDHERSKKHVTHVEL